MCITSYVKTKNFSTYRDILASWHVCLQSSEWDVASSQSTIDYPFLEVVFTSSDGHLNILLFLESSVAGMSMRLDSMSACTHTIRTYVHPDENKIEILSRHQCNEITVKQTIK